jgi:hypothetical protein
MKYFKKFDSYNNINEASDWSISNSWVGKFFGGIGRFIGVNAKKARLIALSREYDSYLDSVYKQYLVEIELDLANNELGDIDIKEITQLVSAAPVSKAKVGKEEGETTTKVEVKMDKDEIIEEIEDEKEDNREDGDAVDETPEIEGSEESTKKPPKDPMHSKIRKIRIEGENIDVSNYNINRSKWASLSDKEQEDVKQNILLYHYEELAQQRAKKDLNKIELRIEDLEERKKEAGRLRSNVSVGTPQRQKYQDMIDEITTELERAYVNRRNTEQELKEAEINLEEFRTNGIEKIIESLSLLKEAKEWGDNDVYSYEWTNVDKAAVTSLINPYVIEEIFLKADHIISSLSSEKTKNAQTKLKHLWDLRIVSVHKKWFYTYNIESLRSKTKAIVKNTDSKKKKQETIKAKDGLTSSFQNQIMNYSSPDFNRIEKERATYYFLTLGTSRIIFIEKVKFYEDDEKYVFKLIGELGRNGEDGVMYLKEDYREKIFSEIQFASRELVLYKGEDKFPIIFFNNSFMYSFEDLNSKVENIDLVSFNLSALSDRLANNVINQNRSFKFKTSEVKEEVLNKIKNEKL